MLGYFVSGRKIISMFLHACNSVKNRKYDAMFFSPQNFETKQRFKHRERTYMQITGTINTYELTRNSHAIAPVQGVPYHWPIGYGNKGFGKVFRFGGKCG